jgi:hypothetical protein
MSAAAVQVPVQEIRPVAVVAAQAPAEISEPGFTDEHPFTVVAIFIAISLVLAGTFVAWLAMWMYSVRYSGVMSVKF